MGVDTFPTTRLLAERLGPEDFEELTATQWNHGPVRERLSRTEPWPLSSPPCARRRARAG